MTEHPIEGLMVTAMNSIQDMVDVNTIIGEPIHAGNNIVIIPISKVTFGFAAGGSEFAGETLDEYNRKDKEEQINYKLPFGGGAGAGVAINPVAFLVINNNNVKLMPVNHSSAIDKLLDYVPDLFEKASKLMSKCLEDKKEKTTEILKQMKENEKDIKENILNKETEKGKVKKISIEKNIKRPEKANLEYEFEYEKNDDSKDGEDDWEIEDE